jgi:predicted O-linked N-acetylglucosamine transferase (SPINDLY family)
LKSDVGLRAFQNAKRQKQHKKEAEGLLSAALAAYRGNRFLEAYSLCRRVLENLPDNFNAMHLAGMCELDTGNLANAEATLKKALELEPRSAEVLSNLGVTLFQMRRFEEARKSYSRAIALRPNYPMALSNLGNTLTRLRLIEEAIEQYDRAIDLKPDYADAYVNRGMAMLLLDRIEQADVNFDRALSFRPGYLEAIVGKGMVQFKMRHFEAALHALSAVLKARSSFSEALAYRGMVYQDMRHTSLAMQDFEAALSLNAMLEVAWTGKAQACLLSNDIAPAIEACQRALELDPMSESAITVLGSCYARLGETAKAVEYYDRALAIKPNYEQAIIKKIFALDFAVDADFETHQAARSDWWEIIGAKIPKAELGRPAADQNRRLVVGYVSSDFRNHSAALTFKPVLRNHNSEAFEVVCYSSSSIEDTITAEFRAYADKWIDASQLSDDELADRIRSDGIDILVDLSGHSEGNRLTVFARKPAAVQVTAWGHATGTGLRTIDYLFSDPTTIPEAKRSLFAEKIHDLPSLITLEAIADLQPSALPMLRKGYVTFGVFNRIDKISEAALAVWCELINAIPLSRIMIKHGALDDPLVRDELVARFVRGGLSQDRIECAGATSREEHLRAFQDVDISLDPFPQNGGVSTWESLYMGVPVVAKLGNGAASRAAAAIVKSIGLDAWVVEDDLQYIRTAEKFAAMPDYLATVRKELPAIIANSQSGNAKHYTRHVEDAYRKFWHEYCGKAAI